jgi:DNA repair protein RecO (recombination protein O)
MPRFKDQAICIRELDWSETSQVVVLLTEAHGQVRGLAKGAKRASPSHMQRFSGGIELLNLGQVVATTRRTAQLATITEWDLQCDFYHLRQDLHAQHLAMYGADLAGALVPELDPRPATFAALRDLLGDLADPARQQAALGRFQWAAIEEGGFQPDLNHDVHGGAALPKRGQYTFDPLAGGFTVEPTPNGWGVRRQTLMLLRSIAAGETIEEAPHEALERVNRLLCVYARSILERELPTMRIVLGAGGQSTA